MTELLPLIFVSLISGLLAVALVAYGHRRSLLVNPNERSSHSEPTPTSGGIAILVAYVAFLCWRYFAHAELNGEIIMLVGLGGLIGLLGFIDDRSPVAPHWRLLIHFVAAMVLVTELGFLPTINFFGWSIENQALLTGLYILGLVWLINLFNFMDGIDGIASIEAVSVLFGVALLLWMNNQQEYINYLIVLAFSVGGFLILNWAPAKIFMGDIGSGFLGFMLGGFALTTSASGAINIWSWVILLGVFIADSTVTLIRRALRQEKIHQPHRSHGYQILSRRWCSHAKVSMVVLVVNVTWLLPLAGLSTHWPTLGFSLAVLAYLPLIYIIVKLGAGTTND